MIGTALPGVAVEPLRGGPVLRWGVIGPGAIAGDWTDTVLANTDQRVVAVAGRSAERASAFARAHGVERAAPTIEALLDDPEVDAVYVATPHSEHARLGALAARAGKHVLIEKPIGVSAVEAERLRTAGATHGVLIAEAMWTRYLPGFSVVNRLLADGALGDVQMATADVGWQATRDAAPRLFDPEQGGGALLDMGVYGFWFAHLAVGAATSVSSIGSFAAPGIDDRVAAVIRGEAGRFATVTVTMTGTNTGLGAIIGTRGALRFLDPFVFPARFAVVRDGTETVWEDTSGLRGRDGLAWQVTAFARAVGDGRTDSPTHPLQSSIEVLQAMDTVRGQIEQETTP